MIRPITKQLKLEITPHLRNTLLHVGGHSRNQCSHKVRHQHGAGKNKKLIFVLDRNIKQIYPWLKKK
jgi:hypothetical protein